MRQGLGFVVILLFAFASSALAQGGPPVPDGCTFAGGVTTCVVTSEAAGLTLQEGDVFCAANDILYVGTSGTGTVVNGSKVTTTEYRGVSQVVKSENVDTRIGIFFGSLRFEAVGTC